jgi:hypothetical protein
MCCRIWKKHWTDTFSGFKMAGAGFLAPAIYLKTISGW